METHEASGILKWYASAQWDYEKTVANSHLSNLIPKLFFRFPPAMPKLIFNFFSRFCWQQFVGTKEKS